MAADAVTGAEPKRVVIYTDGACPGNPGPGGYAAILLYGEHRRQVSGGFRLTTNNRMEIMAAIEALRALKTRCSVTLHTDSQYLVDSMSKGWARRWRSRGWRKAGGEQAMNPDLWQELLTLCERHDVAFVWVPGHAGHPENERCDQLASETALRPDLPPDPGYSRQSRH